MGAYSIVDPPLSERRSNRLRNSNVDFGVLYKLKHLIDLVAQRNYLFTYDGKQYRPLLNVEKAIVVYTRGFTFPGGYSYTALAIRSPSNLFGLWLLVDVRDLRSMIVDNAWNRGRQESEVSLAKGKATLEQLVEWFLSEQLSWGRIATIGPRNALVFADFQWGLSHLDEKSATRTSGSRGAVSLNRGALLATRKLALKSNAVCSWPSGCCSRHNSSRSGGICERTTFVRPTFA
jgi:hypothetical protein